MARAAHRARRDGGRVVARALRHRRADHAAAAGGAAREDARHARRALARAARGGRRHRLAGGGVRGRGARLREALAALRRRAPRVPRALARCAGGVRVADACRSARRGACRGRCSRAAPPLWFGVALGPKNLARIAELGAGWMPMDSRPEALRAGLAKLREAFRARGPPVRGLRRARARRVRAARRQVARPRRHAREHPGAARGRRHLDLARARADRPPAQRDPEAVRADRRVAADERSRRRAFARLRELGAVPAAARLRAELRRSPGALDRQPRGQAGDGAQRHRSRLAARALRSRSRSRSRAS